MIKIQKLKKNVNYKRKSKNFTTKRFRRLNRGVKQFNLARTFAKKAKLIYIKIELYLSYRVWKHLQPSNPNVIPFGVSIILLRTLIVIILLVLTKLGILDIPLDTSAL